MWDEENQLESVVTFTYRSFDKDGNQTAEVERSLYNEEAENLSRLLETFNYFLLGMTFTYVDAVAAFDRDGEEVSSSR
jgi:hypothetical protein